MRNPSSLSQRPRARSFALAAALALATAAAAAAHQVPPASSTLTFSGELVDPQCYLTHDGRGMAHQGCALSCAKGGQTLALLDDATGKLYMLRAENHSKNPNEPWYGYVGKPVVAKGRVFTRGGLAAIRLTSVAVNLKVKPRP